MSKFAKQLAQAQDALRRGDAAACIENCKPVLRQARTQRDALFLTALAQQQLGQLDEAERTFERLLAVEPRNADYLTALAGLLRARGQPLEAARRLKRAVKADPRSVRAWHALGTLHLGRGESAEAMRCAQQLTSLAPTNPAGWEVKAAALQKQGRVDDAIATCREGLKHSPQAARLQYSLAQLLRQDCQFEAAAQAYEAARKAGLEQPDLYINRAEALLEAGDPAEALGCVTAGAARFPTHAAIHRTTARLHAEAGAAGDPLAQLHQAARAHPREEQLWQTLIDLMLRLKRPEEAVAALHEASGAGCPDTPGMQVMQARCKAETGETEAANALYEPLVARYPEDAYLVLNFVEHLLPQGDAGRAAALCEQILRIDPGNQLALAHLGIAWRLLGDPREAQLLDYDRMVMPIRIAPPEGYADTASFFADVAALLEQLHVTRAHPIEQSVRGGTQTNGFLFRLKYPLLQTLERQIRLAVAEGVRGFPDAPDHPFWGRAAPGMGADDFRFSGAWSVRLSDQGFHTNHIHTQGWISSALYISLPDVMADADSDAGCIQFGQPMDELGLDIEPRRIVRPEVGTLVLFPSYMWHGTIPFHSDQPRMTVAFDVLPGSR